MFNKNDNLKSNKQFVMIIMLSFFIQFLYYVSYSYNIEILRYIGILFLIVPTIFMGYRNNLLLFFSLVPNQRLLVLGISDISLINILIFIIAFKQFFIYKKSIEYLAFLLIFILYSTLLIFIGGPFINIFHAFRIVILFLMLIKSKDEYINHKEEFKLLLYSFIFGLIIMSYLGLLFDPNFEISTSYRFSGGEYNNPNDLSVILIVVSDFANLKINRIFLVVSIISLVMFGFLTQSRTFLFGLALAVVLLLIIIYRRFREYLKLKNILYILTIAILIFVILDTQSLILIFNNAINRIIDPKDEDITNGRIQLWIQYYHYFLDNKFNFLVGSTLTQNEFYLLGIKNVAHNSIIELIVDYGLIGSTIALFFFINMITSVFTSFKKFLSNKFYTLIPLMILILLSLSRHNPLNISFFTMFFISLITIVWTNSRSKEVLI
jgi:hypothetical protein